MWIVFRLVLQAAARAAIRTAVRKLEQAVINRLLVQMTQPLQFDRTSDENHWQNKQRPQPEVKKFEKLLQQPIDPFNLLPEAPSSQIELEEPLPSDGDTNTVEIQDDSIPDGVENSLDTDGEEEYNLSVSPDIISGDLGANDDVTQYELPTSPASVQSGSEVFEAGYAGFVADLSQYAATLRDTADDAEALAMAEHAATSDSSLFSDDEDVSVIDYTLDEQVPDDMAHSEFAEQHLIGEHFGI